MTHIDTAFDFTSDSLDFWDGFWERNGGRGAGASDPDTSSPMLQKYHQFLWSKKLPCGKTMKIVAKGKGRNRGLLWDGFVFMSDSIAVSHRYSKMDATIAELKKVIPDYRAYMEHFIHKAYTIGGMMIWPCRRGSINQTKGCNRKIADRMDRTLECIRRYYAGKDSPMRKCLERNHDFFELFVDFKGFVDFFFLQDLVSPNYESVKMLIGSDDLNTQALAQDVNEYRQLLERQLAFVEKRNERIDAWTSSYRESISITGEFTEFKTDNYDKHLF